MIHFYEAFFEMDELQALKYPHSEAMYNFSQPKQRKNKKFYIQLTVSCLFN